MRGECPTVAMTETIPVPHNDPTSRLGHTHHILCHSQRIWREHSSEDAHDEVECMIFQLVQIRRIAFLKRAVREALLLCAPVSSLNKILRYQRLTRPLRVSPLVMLLFHRRIRDPKP